MMNVAIFTNKEYIARKILCATWYDDTLFYNGRGQRLDGAFIDMRLPKEFIKNIIMPSCCFVKDDNIFILNDNQEKFMKSNIDDILKMLMVN